MKYKPIKPPQKTRVSSRHIFMSDLFCFNRTKITHQKIWSYKKSKSCPVVVLKTIKKSQLLLNDLFQLMMIKENWNLKYSIPLFLYDHRYDL